MGRTALLCLILVGGGCNPPEPAPGDYGIPASLEREGAGPAALRTVTAAPVQGRTGVAGETISVALRTPEVAAGHARQIGRETFPIALRVNTPDLGQYPCTSCHVAGEIVVTPGRIDDAHQNIRPVHPAETGATCGTCHAADDVEHLLLISGERVSLDHAYTLCAQCHFGQVDDWTRGVHGKRLDGWQGVRVVMGCADCHDPHSPAVEARIPYPGPILPRTGGQH